MENNKFIWELYFSRFFLLKGKTSIIFPVLMFFSILEKVFFVTIFLLIAYQQYKYIVLAILIRLIYLIPLGFEKTK